MTLPGVKTPQFRTLLLRRLKNLFPGCTARIEDARVGITFQLLDDQGRPLTQRINIYRAHPRTLRKRTLTQHVGTAGVGTH